MIDIDVMIEIYKKEIARLVEENTMLKMYLAQKEKDAKENEAKEEKQGGN